MKNLLMVVAVLLALGSTAYGGGWYVGPSVGYAYYPGTPVYAYPAPVVVAGPRVVYSPVMVPAPVLVPRPVVVGPSGKVYVPGRPVRNTLRAVF